MTVEHPFRKASECPVDHAKAENSHASSCPVDHSSLNPLTNMPYPDQLQKVANSDLTAEREKSTIPRSDSSETWVYPSNLMFYNALKRKGFETAPEDVDMMVQVHNFLNESVWNEVKKWESVIGCECNDPQLKRFMGRPNDLSPKARLYTTLWRAQKPFDRHDWTVNRCGKDVRYIIDYYSGPTEDGLPSFYCDVRPALDSFSNAYGRMKMFVHRQFNKVSE